MRFHALSPLVISGDAHDSHATYGSVTGASSFLIGLVTCFATHHVIGYGGVIGHRMLVVYGTGARVADRVLVEIDTTGTLRLPVRSGSSAVDEEALS